MDAVVLLRDANRFPLELLESEILRIQSPRRTSLERPFVRLSISTSYDSSQYVISLFLWFVLTGFLHRDSALSVGRVIAERRSWTKLI